MTNKNNKVPIAILSCFLIAFILQGVLKISGILVFEKALGWEIFSIIDSHKWLQVCYYSIFTSISVYCLSFALTSSPYSKKWYHYIIVFGTSIANTIIKLNFNILFKYHMLLDVLMYVIIPLIINFTTERKKVLDKNIFNVVLIISIQVALYFCYLGITYWSSLLNTLIIVNPILVSASSNFLINLEVYTGLFTLLLSCNEIIKYIKRRDNMLIPMNISTEEAKVKELEEKKAKKNSKKNGK